MFTEKISSADRVPPSVLVVILNWNGWKDTLNSVESVLRLNYSNLHVLVIDNGSTDGSAPHLRAIHDDRVELVELRENRGYTGGCNEGFKRALAAGEEYVWLLNNDAVVENKDTLSSLVALAESDPKIGLVSPMSTELSEGGGLTYCGGIFSTSPVIHDGTNDPEEALRWAQQYPNAGLVIGAAMLVKTSVVREIGMLDERFFAYWEDIDFSYRSSQAGYRNLVDQSSFIRHPEKYPILNPSAIKPHWWYYMTRNECRIWRKHLGAIRALRPCWWALRKTFRHMLRCKDNQEASDAILAGLWHGWINRGGPYRPEYRMPRMLATAVWKYALARPALSPPVATAPQTNETRNSE